MCCRSGFPALYGNNIPGVFPEKVPIFHENNLASTRLLTSQEVVAAKHNLNLKPSFSGSLSNSLRFPRFLLFSLTGNFFKVSPDFQSDWEPCMYIFDVGVGVHFVCVFVLYMCVNIVSPQTISPWQTLPVLPRVSRGEDDCVVNATANERSVSHFHVLDLVAVSLPRNHVILTCLHVPFAFTGSRSCTDVNLALYFINLSFD